MNHSRLFHFLKDIRVFLYLVLDKIALVGCPVSLQSNTVLLVRLDKIGDFILWFDSAQQLRKYFSGKRLVLIADHTYAELARRCDCFDQVVPVNVKRLAQNPFYRWKTLRLIHRFGAQITVHLNLSRVILAGDTIVRASGSEQKIGSVGDLSNIKPWQKRVSDRWYTRLIPAQDSPLSELERNSEFLLGLGLAGIKPTIARLPVLANLPYPFRFDEPYFILFPGASWCGRVWPVSSFASCLDAIEQKYGLRAVLCGTEVERSLCQAVIDNSASSRSVNLAGQTSLPEFVEFVRGAQLLIGNETSAVHIAAAVDTPAVCILGGGHFRRFLPYPDVAEGPKPVAVFHEMPCYGCNWICTQPHEPGFCVPCINGVAVKDVLRAVSQILSTSKAN